MKSFITKVLRVYFGVGSVVASISAASAVVYCGFGPGAFWEIGFIASMLGFVVGVFMAMTRVVLWPFGLYVLVTNPSGFFPWLFYLWYHTPI
jgi:hypothetical protein